MHPPHPNNLPVPPGGSTHHYGGVGWDRKYQRWFAKIYHHGTRIVLGRYATSHEAALAHNHASFLLNGNPTWGNNIDPTNQPDPARQTEIQSDVTHRLHRRGVLGPVPQGKDPANLATRVSPSSGYRGVYPHRNGRWRAEIKYQGRRLSLGYYPTPHEAALAFNHAAALLYGSGALVSIIPPQHQTSVQRQAEIRVVVDVKLKKYGKRVS